MKHNFNLRSRRVMLNEIAFLTCFFLELTLLLSASVSNQGPVVLCGLGIFHVIVNCRFLAPPQT